MLGATPVPYVRSTRREDLSRATERIGSGESLRQAGVYVLRDRVMSRANISDVSEFLTVAEYLDRGGWIAEADADYGIFVLTPEGVNEATN